MADRSVCRFRVRGRVQGVGFRDATQREALRLLLDGHALNCADGSVDVLACGSPSAVERLAEWLHHGPALARVDAVERSTSSAQVPVGFAVG